ncbi:MAG: hypothetical protein WCI74_05780 [Actinomycetes bacterium]
MADVAMTKERVQAYLTARGPVEIDSDGDFALKGSRSKVWVRVRELARSDIAIIDLWAVLVREVPVNDSMFEWVARNSFYDPFGQLLLSVDDDAKTATVFLKHTLIGDYLDSVELLTVADTILGLVDNYVDEAIIAVGGLPFISAV